MWQLTVKSGTHKGRSWPIQGRDITLGRSRDCDIAIQDPTVSRQHCVIRQGEKALELHDLGSSNTTLVNGDPVDRFRPLSLGDEIAVGSAVFIVTTTRDSRREGPGGEIDEEPKTISIVGESLVKPSVDQVEYGAQGQPRTIRDFTELFSIGRDLGKAGTERELIDTLADHIRGRFRNARICVAKYDKDEEELDFVTTSEHLAHSADKSVLRSMKQALSDQRGLMLATTKRGRGDGHQQATLIAPIFIGGTGIGVFAVETDPNERPISEDDLDFLVSLAHTFAPFFLSVDRVEQLRLDIERLRALAEENHQLLGTSRAMANVRATIRQAAASGLNTLILGETGTGKELAAHMLHALSDRATKPFVIVNCAAIPSDLFESELFGHEKGAFTGAHRQKKGLIEMASEGTLFLDEIGDLSPENQAGILRAIEGGSFRHVGGDKEIRVNFRTVAATNKPLHQEVRENLFRQDLLFRLAGIEIHIPPLRDRPSDIPVLAEHFYERAAAQAKKPLRGISSEAFDYIASRPWAGNARELKNAVERAVGITKNDLIEAEDFRRATTTQGTTPSVLRSLEDVEREHLEAVLNYCKGNVSAAAQILKVHRNTLHNKIAKYGIKV